MDLVVSDTSPLHYLARLEMLDVLPALYGVVLMPPVVWRECLAAATTTSAHFLLWSRAGRVMMSENGAPPQPAAGEGGETFASQSTSVASGADGRLAVVWPHTSPDGHDLFARVYDPQQHTWSDDIPVTADSEAEHQPQAVWDSTGHLTVLYKKAPVTLVTRTVTLPEGGTLQVENVPELGATRLMVSKVPLSTDLALSALTARALSNNWLPGTPVELSVTLENCGHLAVQDVVIGFYDGDPAAGGVKIGEDIIAGLFAGKAKAAPGFSWVLPAPAAAHTVFARMDGFTPAAGGVAVERSDANVANNTVSTLIGGVDYRVRVLDYSLSESAAVRAVVEVTNAGPSLVQPGTLELRALSQPLASVSVPVLAAGEVAEVIIESPAGTQPEGERTYEVRAESGDAALDITPADNRAAFTAKLWLDADEDGLPDGWETEHGLSLFNIDALLDPDLDGANNLLEYALGTSPTDAASLPEKGFTAAMSSDGSAFVFTYLRRSASPYLTGVQTTLNPVAWEDSIFQDVLVSTADGMETRRVTVPVSADARRFFRVHVSAE